MDLARCSVLVLAFWLLSVTAAPAAEPRVALVIGNGGYATLGRLANPVNDMALMAGALRRLGFEVIERADADQAAMKRAIKDFGARLEQAGPDAVGLFYYAGHGVQVQGTNYLIPLAAEIARESEVEIEAVSLDWVLAQMEYARNRINFVILDACRNNPLARSFRSSEQGLSRVDAPRGTLIAYSTAPGSVSLDGESGNSPYTRALAETIDEPGLVAETVFRKVRVAVLEATDGEQVPWESSSLTGAFYFDPDPEPAAERAGAAEAEPEPGPAAELLFWETVQDADDPRLYRAYLDAYPAGLFAGLAQVRLEQLSSGDVEVAAAPAADSPPAPAIPATSPDQRQPSAPTARPEVDAVPDPPAEPARPDGDAGDGAEVDLAHAAVLAGPEPIPGPRLAGRWEGRFRCQRDVLGMALELEPPAEGRISGRFEFFPLVGAPSFPPGSYRVAGNYDAGSGRLRLESGEWIERQWGFQRHGLMGTAMEENGRIIDGRILSAGCGEFALRQVPGSG